MTIVHEPVDGWTEPSAAERLALIQRTGTVAMVGVSANPGAAVQLRRDLPAQLQHRL